MWTENDKGQWKKKAVKGLFSLKKDLGLRGYLECRQKSASAFKKTRWIVFSSKEEIILDNIASLLLGHPASAKNIVPLITCQYSNMTVVSIGDKYRRKNGTADVGRITYRLAVRIQ